MKQHISWRLLAIAAAAALMFAGCGGANDNSSSGSGSGSGGSGAATGTGGSGSGGSTDTGGSGSTGDTTACSSIGNYTATQIPTADEQNCIVGLHNDARTEVGVSPLMWSDTVANVALTYAQKLASQGCPLEHSSRAERNNYGENLASSPSVKAGTEAWISEKSSYTPGTRISNDNYQAFGHYTQVVWKNTTQVGCAYAACNNGATVFICNYDPAGNMLGEAAY